MPTTYRVIIQARAAADLQAIHQHISKDSPQNAASFVAELIMAIDSLQEFPFRFSVYQGRRQPAEAVRRIPVKPYLVYYRVKEASKAVDVLTIRHGARRQPRRF